MEGVVGGASPLGDPRTFSYVYMSYKKKKAKKNIVNQLKRKLRLIKIVLLKKIKSLQKNTTMQQRQTTAIMKCFRERSKMIRQNNLRINDWVDSYIEECVLNGKPVEILIQWCTALGLEKRKEIQGGSFVPTPGEMELIGEELPRIVEAFLSNSVEVMIFITFNRSYVEKRRLSDATFKEYMSMIKAITTNSDTSSRICFLDWESDIIGGIPKPNTEVLDNFEQLVSDDALSLELKNFVQMLARYPGRQATEEELKSEAKFRIACEAEEGKFLTGTDSPFNNGKFILVPLEVAERYVFFKILEPGFQKRIVSILKPYPWRLKSD